MEETIALVVLSALPILWFIGNYLNSIVSSAVDSFRRSQEATTSPQQIVVNEFRAEAAHF